MIVAKDPLREVRGVSAGTLANLIGSNKYDTIDDVQAAWYNWLLDEAEKTGRVFDNWITAWNAYLDATGEEYKRITGTLS